MVHWVLSLLWFQHIMDAETAENTFPSGNVFGMRFWSNIAKRNIDRKLELKPHLLKARRPKNVILFIGDGMGLSTVTSARVNKNQRSGSSYLNSPLYFETFQTTGFVKTKSFDNHVTDSAAGATALLTGMKVKTGTLGTMPSSNSQCTDSPDLHIRDGVAEGALQINMSVGFVTTTRITHATPAALYAKGVHRDAEFDRAPKRCTRDIAKQLLSYPASEFKVLMGGGREYLMDEARNGTRGDGVNVDLEWLNLGGRRRVLRNQDDLAETDEGNNEKLLGIFTNSHFPFYLKEQSERKRTVPRLKEMVEKAIRQLQHDSNGFFLMVEGGLIDIAQHDNWMHMAFAELYEFEEAIRTAREMTDPSDTLIVVTADHGHALTLPGYLPSKETLFESSRTNNSGSSKTEHEFWVPAMFFATGPGYRNDFEHHDNVEIEQPFYRQPAAIPTKLGYHGGEDVGIWADGPLAELFSSTLENTEVAYIMKFVLCAGTTDYSICSIAKSAVETEDSLSRGFRQSITLAIGERAVFAAAAVFMGLAIVSLVSNACLAFLLIMRRDSYSPNLYKSTTPLV